MTFFNKSVYTTGSKGYFTYTYGPND